MSIYRMKNSIRNYPWGDLKFLPELLRLSNPDNRPFAELWMGAHHSAPSKIIINETEIPLPQFIEEHHGKPLPFLFKILCAAQPLSLQVHPEKTRAIEMYRKENEKEIPLDDFSRNYKDDNHKPEILCALTPFFALKGFRSVIEISSLLSPLKGGMTMFLSRILENMDPSNSGTFDEKLMLKDFFTELSYLSGSDKKKLIEMTVNYINGKEGNSPSTEELNDKKLPHYWVKRIHSLYPDDIGILSPYFLNLVSLNPGEAIFLNAGFIHSYLEGSGVELMANSDNVLRSGLTPKNVDIPELLNVVRFESDHSKLVDPISIEQCSNKSQWLLFPTPIKDFNLVKGTGKMDEVLPGKGYRLLLVTEGSVTLSEQGKKNPPVKANRGESLFIHPENSKEDSEDNNKIIISGSGTVFLAYA